MLISENIKFGNVEVSYDNNYGVIFTVPNEEYMVNKVIAKDSSNNIVNTVKKISMLLISMMMLLGFYLSELLKILRQELEI